ncbi:DUF3090 domain-containing protein [Catenulispora pinisilvae]|uniref:DUF3090 domain-containing protein n=1 Tax=Catenulispora pinisilvae TaxID=2705253 RepID=UPI0018917642|nr:DUF3090 domain-containing protein [Catenulispora pinisilvae]
MSRELFVYDPPERFVAGTVGLPGHRTFYLQAADAGGRITSVALEKEQVEALAERLDDLLDEVVRRSGGAAPVPAIAPLELADDKPLEQPVFEEFRVAALALAWDGETQRVVIEAMAPMEGEGEPPLGDMEADGPPTMVVRLTGAQARAFTSRAKAVVSAGRPPCPFCSLPLDPDGHVCPRSNGYRRRAA